MMLVGRLVNAVDPRVLILSGLFFTATSLYYMTQFGVFVPPSMLIWTGALQGFGLGFIFIPLNVVAFATLKPRYRAEAAAMFSLVRNVGSSIGISMVMAVLSRNIQINHAYLTEFLTPFTLGFSWQQIPQSLLSNSTAVLAFVDLEITRQAAAIAYINDFKLMMWVVLASAPLVLFLKRPAPAGLK